MKSTNLSSSLKIYVVPLLSFVVIILLVPLVIVPQLNKIVANSQVIDGNQDRLDQLEAKAVALEHLSQNSAQLNSQLATAEKVLPITKAIAPLVLGVRSIAVASDLQVRAVRLAPGKVATSSAAPANTSETAPAVSVNEFSSNKSEVVFEMQLVGKLTSVRDFFEVLERGRRLITLKSFKLIREGRNYNAVLFFAAPYSSLPTLSADQIAQGLPEITQADQDFLDLLSGPRFIDVTTTDVNSGQTGTSNPF